MADVFILRVTDNPKQECVAFRRNKFWKRKALEDVAYVYTTSVFGMKLWVEKVERGRERCCQSMLIFEFSMEEKVMFSRGEVMLHVWKSSPYIVF